MIESPFHAQKIAVNCQLIFFTHFQTIEELSIKHYCYKSLKYETITVYLYKFQLIVNIISNY